MARTQTMVQLNSELLDVLDRAAERRGASRSSLIRELLWAGLARDREAVIGERIVDGYRRLPPGAPDAWGDLEAAADASADEVMARLEAEEREAGHGPW